MTNSKTLKKAFFMSLLSILLCVSMLIGSTFAWFTDTATTGVNTITAGKLDVDIVDAQGNSLNGEPLKWETADNRAQAEILWEPGCTYNLEGFKIINKGDLALQYMIVISGINGDAELNQVIDWTMTIGNEALDLNAAYNLNAGAKSETIVISGHMQETAGNTYMGKTIDSISIKVLATQYTHESDSNGNTYDAGATFPENKEPENTNASVGTAADLKAILDKAFENGGTGDVTVTLTQNINVDDQWTTFKVPNTAANITIDGAGYTISNLNKPLVTGLWGGYGTLTFKNLTIDSADIADFDAKDVGGTLSSAGAFMAYSDAGTDIVFENCYLTNSTVTGDADYTGGLIGYASTPVTFKNCSVIGSTITSAKSAGGLVGHMGAKDLVVNTCSVTNTTLNGLRDNETDIGEIFGRTSGSYTVTMTSITNNGNTLVKAYGTTSQATLGSKLYGSLNGYTATLDGNNA